MSVSVFFGIAFSPTFDKSALVAVISDGKREREREREKKEVRSLNILKRDGSSTVTWKPRRSRLSSVVHKIIPECWGQCF